MNRFVFTTIVFCAGLLTMSCEQAADRVNGPEAISLNVPLNNHANENNETNQHKL